MHYTYIYMLSFISIQLISEYKLTDFLPGPWTENPTHYMRKREIPVSTIFFHSKIMLQEFLYQ